jgi:hypothetical protein
LEKASPDKKTYPVGVTKLSPGAKGASLLARGPSLVTGEAALLAGDAGNGIKCWADRTGRD